MVYIGFRDEHEGSQSLRQTRVIPDNRDSVVLIARRKSLLVTAGEASVSRFCDTAASQDGLRSEEEQQKLFDAGKSQTMKSKHLTGDAVDLMAYVDGKASWELNLYDDLADAARLDYERGGPEVSVIVNGHRYNIT